MKPPAKRPRIVDAKVDADSDGVVLMVPASAATATASGFVKASQIVTVPQPKKETTIASITAGKAGKGGKKSGTVIAAAPAPAANQLTRFFVPKPATSATGSLAAATHVARSSSAPVTYSAGSAPASPARAATISGASVAAPTSASRVLQQRSIASMWHLPEPAVKPNATEGASKGASPSRGRSAPHKRIPKLKMSPIPSTSRAVASTAAPESKGEPLAGQKRSLAAAMGETEGSDASAPTASSLSAASASAPAAAPAVAPPRDVLAEIMKSGGIAKTAAQAKEAAKAAGSGKGHARGGGPGVWVGTAHQAKGGEWHTVFVYNVIEGLFPISVPSAGEFTLLADVDAPKELVEAEKAASAASFAAANSGLAPSSVAAGASSAAGPFGPVPSFPAAAILATVAPLPMAAATASVAPLPIAAPVAPLPTAAPTAPVAPLPTVAIDAAVAPLPSDVGSATVAPSPVTAAITGTTAPAGAVPAAAGPTVASRDATKTKTGWRNGRRLPPNPLPIYLTVCTIMLCIAVASCILLRLRRSDA
jgi:hypothetical protein